MAEFTLTFGPKRVTRLKTAFGLAPEATDVEFTQKLKWAVRKEMLQAELTAEENRLGQLHQANMQALAQSKQVELDEDGDEE